MERKTLKTLHLLQKEIFSFFFHRYLNNLPASLFLFHLFQQLNYCFPHLGSKLHQFLVSILPNLIFQVELLFFLQFLRVLQIILIASKCKFF